MRKILFLSCVILLLMVNSITAQKKTANKVELDSTLLYINGKGLFVNLGKKEKTVLNFSTAIQTGGAYSQLENASGTQHTDRFSINLARIYFTGSFINEKVLMGLTTDFTGTTGILEAWVGVNFFEKHLLVSMGQRQTNTNNRLALSDERFGQELAQTIDGTSKDGVAYGGLMQNFVGATREDGLFFDANFSINKMRIYPSIAVTTGNGQGINSTQENLGFKYGGRLDIMPLGDFKFNNAFISHDMYFETSPKFAFGIAGSYNVKASHATGSGANQITGIYDANGNIDYANYAKIVSDFIFKYKGFSFISEFTSAAVKGKNLYIDSAGNKEFTALYSSSKYNTGTVFNLQSSYMFKSGWVIDTRFTNINPEYSVQESLIQKQNWYTFGINKYNKYKNLKIGINTTYIDNFNTETKYNWYSNLAVQFIL
ncbi:hypothetical protein [Flavobacterium sp. IMCC34518]|uniref:hypothetical protein n=1 Tax=Flavobacterium sp. IMCC34518 TaxID=3003623 RepID=UPI0024826879|nr:hypothetical protein [Flavobacterium sp. IMCC34518]